MSGRDGGQCCFSLICVQSTVAAATLAFGSDVDAADVDDEVDAVIEGVDDIDDVDRAVDVLVADTVTLPPAPPPPVECATFTNGVCGWPLLSSLPCDN